MDFYMPLTSVFIIMNMLGGEGFPGVFHFLHRAQMLRTAARFGSLVCQSIACCAVVQIALNRGGISHEDSIVICVHNIERVGQGFEYMAKKLIALDGLLFSKPPLVTRFLQ